MYKKQLDNHINIKSLQHSGFHFKKKIENK